MPYASNISVRKSKSESPLSANPSDHSSTETILYSPAERFSGSNIPKSTVIASSAFLYAVPNEYTASEEDGSSLPTFRISRVFPSPFSALLYVFLMSVEAKSTR